MLKEYLKIATKEWNDVYYMREWNGYFRISKKLDNTYIFTDEVEKIELSIDNEWLTKLHNLLKWENKVQKIMKDNQSIKNTLETEFANGDRKTFLDKPYIVYDLETIWTSNDLKTHEISVWYMMDSTSWKYSLIEKHNTQKVLDHMVKFDWWIVWFYSLWFDNPVLVNNAGIVSGIDFDQEKLDILNSKSIDIFFFVQKLLGRRMGLNKLAEWLVWVKKSLESWIEGANLYKEYLETGEKKLLDAVKKYCKNDVTMTHLLFLYLVKYKKLFDEWQEIIYTDNDILTYGQLSEGKDLDANTFWQQNIFW